MQVLRSTGHLGDSSDAGMHTDRRGALLEGSEVVKTMTRTKTIEHIQVEPAITLCGKAIGMLPFGEHFVSRNFSGHHTPCEDCMHALHNAHVVS